MREVRETSLQSWREVQFELGDRQLKVFQEIRDKKYITNAMLSRNIGLPINSITPRTNELVKKGLVREGYRDRCPVTGRVSIFWEVAV